MEEKELVEKLYLEIGRLHMESKDLRGFNMTLADKIELLETKCESLEMDLTKAMSLADLSKEGSNTPNPFQK